MAVAFVRGDLLGSDDLKVTLTDENGNPFDPFYISYTIYGKSDNRNYGSTDGKPFKVGQAFREPSRVEKGVYFVVMKINSSFLVGSYYAEWIIRREANSPLEVVGKSEFAVYNN